MNLTIIVPTFNEKPNVEELVRRVADATYGLEREIIFVDDSTDDTPREIARVAALAAVPVRLIHRDEPAGGLGGAVVEGMHAAASDVCMVMDGDLQHPPETIPLLLERYSEGDADVVIASRYAGGGTAHGLGDAMRHFVSKASTLLTKAMFPNRLHGCSDPMTGFFLIDRRAVDIDKITPRGFKILLELLARQQLRVAEVPFDFAPRHAGSSKASFRQGIHFLTQLTMLRFGKMSAFALIGGLGAVVNLLIMAGLTHIGVGYISAAIVAAETTIVGNFLLQERFVFRDMIDEASSRRARFLKSFSFNNAEALIRIPLLALLVETWHVSSIVAAALTLAVAFVARFAFHSLVVYAPKKQGAPSRARQIAEAVDEQAMQPGEL